MRVEGAHSCLRYIAARMSWTNANNNCNALLPGAHLLTTAQVCAPSCGVLRLHAATWVKWIAQARTHIHTHTHTLECAASSPLVHSRTPCSHVCASDGADVQLHSARAAACGLAIYCLPPCGGVLKHWHVGGRLSEWHSPICWVAVAGRHPDSEHSSDHHGQWHLGWRGAQQRWNWSGECAASTRGRVHWQ